MEIKNNYMIFGYDTYYPRGGWNDFIGFAETIEDGKERAKAYEWWHMVNIKTGKMEIFGNYEEQY